MNIISGLTVPQYIRAPVSAEGMAEVEFIFQITFDSIQLLFFPGRDRAAATGEERA